MTKPSTVNDKLFTERLLAVFSPCLQREILLISVPAMRKKSVSARAFAALGLLSGLAALIIAGWYATRPVHPTLDEKIGQMLMFGFSGSRPDGQWARRLSQQISDGEVGGVVFLGHNFKTREDVIGLTGMFGKARRDLPAFLALDMEGGFVQRLGGKLGYDKIPPAQTIAETMSVPEARKQFDKLAAMTAEAGFNVNLGPVVDLRVNPDNPVIAKWRRSYGRDGDKVVAFARSFIAAHRQRNILAVLKHYPGHGSSLSDSHDGFVDISATWTAKELLPFKKLIETGSADAIMPGHLILNRGDAKPVSLSKTHIAGGLRSELKFNGLVICDDLQMAAIRKNYTYEAALILAINAGVDVLMISNSAKPDLELPAKTIKIIKQAVNDNRITKSRIDSAYHRVLAAKKSLRR